MTATTTQQQLEQNNTVQVIPFAGKSSFAFDNAKKRAIQYLKNIDMQNQIPHIPDIYPSQSGQLVALDLIVIAKILRAHLEDAFFTQNVIFSVKITRRKTSPVIRIIHDSGNNRQDQEKITQIAKLYTDSTTKLLVVTTTAVTQ